ncbi:ATP-binding protein [bacterium]|nr:ATP-binding protein [bacterium]
MEVQLETLIQEKILSGIESPLPTLTRRDARVPDIPGKAMVVIGMRRAGKTSFLHQQRADRIAAGRKPERQVYFNFEDERLAGMKAGQLGLIPETHLRLFPESTKEPVTFYLDEIQVVPGWETFVRRMLDEGGHELFLSGSSAKLLSREIATSMRGRAWEIQIHPFSFREWLRHHGHEIPESTSKLTSRRAALLDKHFVAYLETGGFPEAQGLALRDRRQLLQGYVDVLLFRDVIERHGVSNVTALRWMVRRLLGNPGGLFSVTKFEADLKSQGIRVGRETLYELLDHLEDGFLLQTMPIASDSEKRRQVNPRKAYPVDHGLTPVFDRSQKSNRGHSLEVSVHNELFRRGAEVAYVKTKSGYEVDFLSREANGEQTLIQVCSSIDDPDTLDREARALLEAKAEHHDGRLLLLTAASRMPFPEVPDSIEIMPVWQWMLDNEEF